MTRRLEVNWEEFNRKFAAAGPPTPDDVSHLTTGEALDSREAVEAWLARDAAARAAAEESRKRRGPKSWCLI